MANRPRKYYPQQFITTGLYTAGKEWMTIDGTEYIGVYHTYIDGFTMTLANYDPKKSETLVPYDETITEGKMDKLVYDSITTSNIKKQHAPVTKRVTPTEDQRSSGFMVRYILQRRNDPTKYYEVDEDDFKTLQKANKGINGGLYKGIIVDWKLSGPEYDVLNADGSIKEYGVVDTNRRVLFDLDRTYPGIATFMNDLREFTIYDDIKK
jgi:hypothetical protein